MNKKSIVGIIILILLIFTLVGLVAFMWMSTDNIDGQIERGNKYIEAGDNEKAITAFEKALDIDRENVEAYTQLANLLIEAGNLDETVKVLKTGIRKTDSEELVAILDSLRPVLPEASPESGAYEDIVEFILPNEEGVVLYYTLDGTVPTKDSSVYDMSLILTEPTEIKILAINELELESEIATYSYDIQPKVVEPEVVEPDVPEGVNKNELLASVAEGRFDGIEFGVGSTFDDIRSAWGEANSEDYFAGGPYLVYDEVVFFGNPDGVVQKVAYTGTYYGYTMFGLSNTMTKSQIIDLLGEPDYANSALDNEMNEFAAGSWTIEYVIGLYSLELSFAEENSTLEAMMIQ